MRYAMVVVVDSGEEECAEEAAHEEVCARLGTHTMGAAKAAEVVYVGEPMRVSESDEYATRTVSLEVVGVGVECVSP